MERLRVLHIIPTLQTGGAQGVATNLACLLDRSRFQVGVCSLYDSGGSTLDRVLTNQGLRVWHLGKRRGFDYRMLFEIGRVLTDFRPVVVHTHQYVLRYTLLPTLLRRIPVLIHTVHTFPSREVGPLGRVVHRMAFRAGLLPVAVCNEVALEMRQLYGNCRLEMIPNGIAVANYGTRSGAGHAGRIVFVCVANLTRPKNYPLLLEAFAAGPAKFPNVRLDIAGDGALRAELEEQASALNIAGKVRFLGACANVPAVLAAADVFVLASDWEGRPLSLMEAMAAGKAAICTKVGGIAELIRHNSDGILVERGDREALAASMVALYKDLALRTRLGKEAARRAAAEFDASRMAEGYARLYEERVRRGGSR